MTRSFKRNMLLLTTSISLALPAAGGALPTGGSVASGSATISNTATQTTVKQYTSKAIINWTGFNTSKGQTVEFNDPNSSSITLNRVSGTATSFDGALSSNGNVWVINPNGILFGKDAQVNVNGLLATSSNITNTNFNNGTYNFTPGSNGSAVVSNAGSITVNRTIANTGLAALVAPNVANSGTINAKAGTIALASGDTYTVDLAGDGLINLAASKSMVAQGLANTGTLNATGGSVTLTAAQASGIVDNLINLDGVVEANNLTASNQSGDLEYGANFSGSTGGNFTLSAYRNIAIDSGTVIAPASGKLNVVLDSDTQSTAQGGAIYMADNSVIDSNGGNITLGGKNNPAIYHATASDTPGVDANGNFIYTNGVFLDNAALIAGGGNIIINGQGASSPSSNSEAVNSEGVRIGSGGIEGGGVVATSGNGTITINGIGTQAASSGTSVGVDAENALIQSTAGAINITGTGGNGSLSYGVFLNTDQISATSGAITISGKSGSSTENASVGISDLGFSTGSISTTSGAINLTGTGITHGIDVLNGSITSNTGKVTLTGTGTGTVPYMSDGIYLSDASLSSTGTGSNASTFTLNGSGAGFGIDANISSFSTVNGNFYLNGSGGAAGGIEAYNSSFSTVNGNYYFNEGVTGPNYLTILNDPTFTSTGQGTFNFGAGAIITE